MRIRHPKAPGAQLVEVDPARLASLDAEPSDRPDRWVGSLVYTACGVSAVCDGRVDGTVAACLLVSAVGSFAEATTDPAATLDAAIAALRSWRDDIAAEPDVLTSAPDPRGRR